MRITILSAFADMSGGSRVLATYASRLRDRGHEVHVVSRPFPSPGLRERLRRRLRRLPAPDTGHNQFTATGVDFREIESFRPIEARDVPDADVVIATWWETAEWVAGFPPEKGRPVYFIQGWEAFPGLPLERVEATWRLPFLKIAVSRWLVDIGRRFGDPHVRLVPNAVDLELFDAPPRGRLARPTVGTLYSASRFKGLDVVLDALGRLRAGHPGLHLVMLGSERPRVDTLLPPDVEFHYLPAQDRLREVYARCDVWVSASRMEGFGLPLLEACACRTPVVATRSGGPQDIVEEGGNGFLVDVDDAAGLAAAISRVLALPEEEWRRLSDGARARAERYSWDDALALFEAALADAAKG